ncbi:site-specific integrase [Pseudomonas cavernicola]|uniref:Site-specific integrase n=1 Tax=Pseudomonas cavernicola TaxID=2320866 RepID=A0A418X9A2_9PSED|nr:site-specific integrase [Pseudomonas cavernicola]RJG09056.1 site-specific integrase [Pseudomonas cavernicola]
MPRLRLRDPILPPALVGWLLLDSLGRPRYWSTVWTALAGAELADSTLSARLATLEQFYQSVASQCRQDCLDRLITQLDFDLLETCLEGYFVSLCNRGAQDRTDHSTAWRAVLGFVEDCLQRLVKNNPDRSSMWLLNNRLQRLEQLYHSLNPRKKRPAEIARALPSGVIEDLYQLIDPLSARNPFRTEALRWRNFVIVLLMLHQGLRRGETLVLALDALKDQVMPKSPQSVRYWLDVIENPYEPSDPRSESPNLKNAYAVRQLPVAPVIASAIQTFVNNYRIGAAHSYLFSSQEGSPLSNRSVNAMFQVLSSHLSPAARQELFDRRKAQQIKPHDMRHTCATVRLKQFVDAGEEMDMAIQKLRVFFGWSRTSQMPQRYARAYFEDRLVTVWADSFDLHIDALRQLGGVTKNA